MRRRFLLFVCPLFPSLVADGQPNGAAKVLKTSVHAFAHRKPILRHPCRARPRSLAPCRLSPLGSAPLSPSFLRTAYLFSSFSVSSCRPSISAQRSSSSGVEATASSILSASGKPLTTLGSNSDVWRPSPTPVANRSSRAHEHSTSHHESTCFLSRSQQAGTCSAQDRGGARVPRKICDCDFVRNFAAPFREPWFGTT